MEHHIINAISQNPSENKRTICFDAQKYSKCKDAFCTELFTSDSLLELCNSYWKRSPNAKKLVQPYLRGCKWSPDGTCCLSVVNNDGFHIMELPRDLYEGYPAVDRMITMLPSTIHVKEAGIVYDFCWYPKMNSYIPETCSWISTKKNSPIQMWDAYNGTLKCSYRGFNAVDEMEPALCVAFAHQGSRIIGGYKNCLRTFNVESLKGVGAGTFRIYEAPNKILRSSNTSETDPDQDILRFILKLVMVVMGWSVTLYQFHCILFKPGRDFFEHKIKSPASCIAINDKIMAVGSWNTNIKLFSISDMGTYKSIGNMYGHSGGVTHIQFIPNKTKIVTGARKDHNIMVWDIRYFSKPLNILKRCVTTNQRIYFDISACGRYLVSGGTDGVVRIWDENKIKWTENYDVRNISEESATYSFHLHQDSCNSVSINPCRPILATGSGQFHLADPLKILEQESDECLQSVIIAPIFTDLDSNEELTVDTNGRSPEVHKKSINEVPFTAPNNIHSEYKIEVEVNKEENVEKSPIEAYFTNPGTKIIDESRVDALNKNLQNQGVIKKTLAEDITDSRTQISLEISKHNIAEEPPPKRVALEPTAKCVDVLQNELHSEDESAERKTTNENELKLNTLTIDRISELGHGAADKTFTDEMDVDDESHIKLNSITEQPTEVLKTNSLGTQDTSSVVAKSKYSVVNVCVIDIPPPEISTKDVKPKFPTTPVESNKSDSDFSSSDNIKNGTIYPSHSENNLCFWWIGELSNVRKKTITHK